jgi:hypothetical protein
MTQEQQLARILARFARMTVLFPIVMVTKCGNVRHLGDGLTLNHVWEQGYRTAHECRHKATGQTFFCIWEA